MLSHSRRILIVDDDEDTCSSLSDVLTDAGYDVDVAYRGWDALEMAGRKPYGLALVDLRLPCMTGIELFGRLQQCCQELKAMLVTGFAAAGHHDRRDDRRNGFRLRKTGRSGKAGRSHPGSPRRSHDELIRRTARRTGCNQSHYIKTHKYKDDHRSWICEHRCLDIRRGVRRDFANRSLEARRGKRLCNSRKDACHDGICHTRAECSSRPLPQQTLSPGRSARPNSGGRRGGGPASYS